MNKEQLKGKKVAILGVGMEGIALANFLLDFCQDITLLDKLSAGELAARAQGSGDEMLLNILADNRFSQQFGPNYLENLNDFEIIFRSPGIPYLEPKIQQAVESGIQISSQIKLFFDLCPCPIIGVTGTKGKGTTSSLIESMLNNNQEVTTRPDTDLDIEKKNIYLAGNIGQSAISRVNKLSADDIVILELSSFQLQDMDVSPHIAVVLNISSDHLDYHKDEEEYHQSKENIVKYQKKTDFAVINQDYLTSYKFAAETEAEVFYFSAKDSVDKGSYVRKFQNPNSKLQNQNNHEEIYEVVLRINEKDEIICKSNEIQLIGKHNLENIAAASVAASIAGATLEAIRLAAKEFIGLPHRLEFVAEINEVKFYNDSYATNPAPTMAAIKSFTAPVHIILGGSSKGADFSQMAREIAQSSVSSITLIGVEAKIIESALKSAGYKKALYKPSGDISEIVAGLSKLAEPGEVVLLSPACASFGMFKNYKDRGEKFKQAVLLLK